MSSGPGVPKPNTAGHPGRKVDPVTYAASRGEKGFVARQTGPSSYRWSLNYGGEQGVASTGSVSSARHTFSVGEDPMSSREMRRSMKQTGSRFIKR